MDTEQIIIASIFVLDHLSLRSGQGGVRVGHLFSDQGQGHAMT